jgi:spore germination protein YaaH
VKKFLAFLSILFLLFYGLWFFLGSTFPTTSPIKSFKHFLSLFSKHHAKLTTQVIGFLPYWKIDDAKYARLYLLSEINYFSLTTDKNGKFVRVVENQTDPGWREWNNQTLKDLIAQAQISGTAFTFTVTALQNDLIESILDDKERQQTLINEIIDQIKSRRLDGVTIDFEYIGDAQEQYQNKFTAFAASLSQTMHKQTPRATLTLTLIPRAARDKGIFDIKKLVPLFDRFIGMSYDYYGMSADIAGPVAPMKGFKENKFFFDVTTTYADYEKYIPKEKIVMGIPYYGWDYAVEDGQKINSKTFTVDNPQNYAAIESYARAREDNNIKSDHCQWDEYAEEPWCWYTDEKSNTDHQVWFEDTKSIGIKYDYAKKQNFTGIAIWVLGYDKAYPDLWNLIKEKFSEQ